MLPGLFDCHTHLCASISFRGRGLDAFLSDLLAYTSQTTEGYRALQGAANAASMLEAGFTTVRDLGNAGLYADTDLRRARGEGALARAHHRQRRPDHRAPSAASSASRRSAAIPR